ncbi:MAG: hypothetical protein COY66_02750 [Candidatus Kerfeldbacteria bacterium CG_4_10_14_0_8_um_filter_42_10]|uniref:ARC6 IMS domain-containing protein n=1 Tax=Candidatus Kerfeldbacteria bacterium CG_4_10_14_0_8_um_filter_42_10 TaxID=2014248 RepID=A0A2M7RJR2_9BACT|nr:MAG: hypothetical protein COY66_02750 [Candidatus Kerfeldbacteria bacterium CG_4_10_14_0_8_um_filter_42_10]
MNKNLKVVFIVVAALTVILTIVALVVAFLTADKKGTNQNTNVTITNEGQTTNITPGNTSITNTNGGNTNTSVTNTNDAEPTTTVEASLKTTASNFTERFGSYSNDSNFENITKLAIYMSESMQEWADNYVEEQQADNQPDAAYYGITTKVLSTKTVSLDENKGTAEFTVSTQRRETSGNQDAKVFYQDLSIKFIKESGSWKVNEANWQAVQ